MKINIIDDYYVKKSSRYFALYKIRNEENKSDEFMGFFTTIPMAIKSVITHMSITNKNAKDINLNEYIDKIELLMTNVTKQLESRLIG